MCVSAPDAPGWKQADGKRELEYRAGEEDADQASDKPEKQQEKGEEGRGSKQEPETEVAQPEDDQQPGQEEDDEEGPMNEQAGEAGKQQSFTTPEASHSDCFPVYFRTCVCITGTHLPPQKACRQPHLLCNTL